MIIIWCEIKIFSNNLTENGWTNNTEKNRQGLISKICKLFCFAAVPILRLFVAILIVVMATYKKEVLQKELNITKSDEKRG
jgi:hypothetical protein